MRVFKGHFAPVRELIPIFIVAVGVALASTLAGSVFDRIHRVDAEELTAAEKSATPGPDGTQVLTLADWGVQLSTPLASEMPILKYTTRSGDAVGLSSADLEPLGPNCIASRNALGVILRAPVGTYATSKHGGKIEYYMAAVGAYEYTFQMPQSACSDKEPGRSVINRETSVLIDNLSNLTATTP